MKLLVVYDTSTENCAKLHAFLKRYLFWNQRSCFEGEVTESQLFEIETIIMKKRAESSHICFYLWKDSKTFCKKEIGVPKGSTTNVI